MTQCVLSLLICKLCEVWRSVSMLCPRVPWSNVGLAHSRDSTHVCWTFTKWIKILWKRQNLAFQRLDVYNQPLMVKPGNFWCAPSAFTFSKFVETPFGYEGGRKGKRRVSYHSFLLGAHALVSEISIPRNEYPWTKILLIHIFLAHKILSW